MSLSRRAFFSLLLSQLTEFELGKQFAKEHEKNIVLLDNHLLTAYVAGIVKRLGAKSERPGVTFTTKVVDAAAVDAGNFPGGFIFVNRGLLEFVETESELAGALAHEVGHIAASHGMRALAHPSGSPLERMRLLRYTRADEIEADRLGFYNMIRAGWNPQGLLNLMERIARLSGDKDTAERYAAFRNEMKRVSDTSALISNTLSFRAMKLGLKLL